MTVDWIPLCDEVAYQYGILERSSGLRYDQLDPWGSRLDPQGSRPKLGESSPN